MDPAAAVLHSSQQIFEGLKAYRTADGGAVMFRPETNAQRFQKFDGYGRSCGFGSSFPPQQFWSVLSPLKSDT
jgi:hypothetical protein